MRQLKDEVINLIQSVREGEYWDFKQEPHSNKAALLHDIICFSNSLYKGDKYIIIGVSDPSNNCEIVGLANGQDNRKNQADLIDFVRSKAFAADIRPEVELVNLEINSKEVDVIIIKDNPLKPYYLTSEYRDKSKCIRANHIYTRIGDTNTAINASADLYHVEKMWRQRFGLDLTPSERLKLLMSQPEQWVEDFGNSDYAYHKDFPEFRIEVSSPERMKEPYCEFYPNNNGYYGKAYFKYLSNILFELDYIYCDEMRTLLAHPDIECVNIGGEDNWFYYYDLSSWNGIFLKFLFGRGYDFFSRGSSAPFLTFRNEDELEKFSNYLEDNEVLIKAIETGYVPSPSNYSSVISLEFLCKSKIIYEQYLWK